MNKFEILFSSIKGNTIINIDYIAKVKMNKGGREGKNTLYNSNVMKYVRSMAQIGNIYENSVNNRAEKENGVRTFETEGMRGFKWVKFPYIMESISSGERYVRMYKINNIFDDVIYLVDGHLADDNEMAIIKEYEVNSGYSRKQAENGLEKNQVKVRNINLNNIVKVVCNGVEIKTDNEEVAKVYWY